MLKFWTKRSNSLGNSEVFLTQEKDWSFDPPSVPGEYQMRHVLDGKQFGEIADVTVLANQNFERFDTIQWRTVPNHTGCQ